MKQITLLVNDDFLAELEQRLYIEKLVGTLTMKDPTHYIAMMIVYAVAKGEDIIELKLRKEN